ncbi:LEA type 2 family protein [Oceanithermus sp.]
MKKAKWLLGSVVLLILLAGCLPRLQEPLPPRAQVQNFQLLSVDPFSDNAQFALDLKISNPNNFELPLLESTLTLYFGDARIPFDLPRMTIPASGFETVPTRVTVPLAASAREVQRLLAGETVRVRITGKMKAELGPVPVTLGPFTLLDENVRVDLRFAAPSFKLAPERSSLALSGSRLRVTVGFQVTNPNPLGFYLRGPVQLVIAGRPVASAGVDLPLRPRQSGMGELVFDVNLSEVPGAAAAVLAGLQVEVRGGVKAEIPGIWQQGLDLLLGGRIR